MTRPFRWAGLVAVALMAGCAGMQPSAVQPGQSGDEVLRTLGAPTSRYALADGATRLEYAGGPYGLKTWMVDLAPDGRVRQVRQVLDEPTFAQVHPGDTRDDVLRQIGRPGHAQGAFRDRTLWYWRYENYLCKRFIVTLDPSGRVQDAGYGPDPACEDDDRDLMRRP